MPPRYARQSDLFRIDLFPAFKILDPGQHIAGEVSLVAVKAPRTTRHASIIDSQNRYPVPGKIISEDQERMMLKSGLRCDPANLDPVNPTAPRMRPLPRGRVNVPAKCTPSTCFRNRPLLRHKVRFLRLLWADCSHRSSSSFQDHRLRAAVSLL